MKKRVLFLCPENNCHSQMAEGLLKHFYGDKYEVFSAGVSPTCLNKNAVEVMKEIGVDISKQTSKHVNNFLDQKFDVIVTLCDKDRDSYENLFSKAQRLRWDFIDPSEGLEYQKDLPKALREVRDGIKTKIIEHF